MDREVLKNKISSGKYKKYKNDEITKLCKELCLNENRQKVICIEELCELTQEVTRYIRGRGDEVGIREEIADAFLVLKCIGTMIEDGDVDLDDTEYIGNFEGLYNTGSTNPEFILFTLDYVFHIMHLVDVSYATQPLFDKDSIHKMYDHLIAVMAGLCIKYSEIREYINVKVERQEEKINNGTVI